MSVTYCEIDTDKRFVDDVFVLLGRYSVTVCEIGPVLRCFEYDDLDDAVKKIEELVGDDNVSLSCHTPR
jgi:hypothetical protein